MKKLKKPLLFFILIAFGGILITQSCRKPSDFEDMDAFLEGEFEEIYNISTDQMFIDGSVAVPILNTKFKIGDFVPELDSSFWVEVDNNDLVHLRMYYDSIMIVSGGQIFPEMPANEGTTIPAHTFKIKSDTSKIKLYDHALSGHLFFLDPKITLFFDNRIPLTTYINLDSLIFHNSGFDTISTTPHIDATIASPTVAGQSVASSMVITKNEMPILPEVFSPIPKYLSFLLTVGSQTEQTLPFTATGNEKLVIDADIDAPLDAKLVDFVLGDTADYDFGSDTTNFGPVEAVTIKLMFDNFIPAGGVASVSFHDVNNAGVTNPEPILELTNGDDGEPFEFVSAITDGNGVPTSSVESDFTIHLTKEQVEILKTNHASKIVYKGTFNSYQSQQNNQFVKIYSWCTLGIKLGIKVDYAGGTGDIPQ